VFLFFGLFLGFLVNNAARSLSWYDNPREEKFTFDTVIFKLVIFFTAVMLISCIVTIFRYSNFFPFITNEYHNLAINVDGTGSTGSMIWTIRFFYNYLIGFLFLFLVFNVVKGIRDILSCLIILVCSTMVSVGVVLYQYFVNPYLGNIKHWVDSGRFNATFTDPNALGAFTILLFPVFIGLTIYYRKWYIKLVFFIAFILFLILLFLSGSRSAFAGIALAVFVFAILFIIRGVKYFRKRFILWPKKKKLIMLSVIVFLFFIIAFAIFYLFFFKMDLLMESSLVERTINTFKTGIHYSKYGIVEALKSISNFRYIYWGQAVEMFKDYPVTGVGHGSYILQLPNYLISERAGILKVDYSGNYYLQVLSELGFVGFVLIMSIFFIFIKRVLQYFKGKNRNGVSSRSDWILISLFIAFAAMLLGQVFGPHTNFDEIQLTFWLIIGLMLAYLKIEQIEKKSKISVLKLGNRIRFSIREKISLSVVLFIFFAVFLFNSLTTLSINVSQNLYDIKGNYRGWQNNYGFYSEEVSEEGPFRWAAPDASIVLEKKGDRVIIPIKDAYPEEPEKKLAVRVFIDNILVEKAYLDYNKWENVEVDIPDMVKEHFTITLVFNRSWSPLELGINNDSRVFGAKTGDFVFISGKS